MKWIVAAFLVLCAACATGVTHTVDQAAESVPQLKVTAVVVFADRTEVQFVYRAADRGRRIGVHAPGEVGAFLLTDADTGQPYALRKVQGVAILPARTTVAPNEGVEFSLTFDSIPSTTKRVHVGEGDYRPQADETAWHVRGIVLQ